MADCAPAGTVMDFYVDHRRYFTLGSFYAEIGKPWPERALPMVHEPRPGALGLVSLAP